MPQPKLVPSCWFLTFGLPHIGLGILSRSLCDQKSNLVFDTGLFNAMKFPPNLGYIRFNRKKNNRNLLRSFLSHNIHKSVIKNKLVFQESLLDYELYAMLIEEWGEPTAAFSLTTNYDFFKKKYFEKKFKRHRKNQSKSNRKILRKSDRQLKRHKRKQRRKY